MATAQRIAHFGSWELDLENPDVDANHLRWSDECYRVFGFEPRTVEVTNDLFFERVHPADRTAIREAVTKALREGGEYSMVHRIALPSGEIRHIREQARVFTDERTGRPLKMIGTAHDITDQKRAEDTLLRDAELLAVLPDAIMCSDLEGTVTYWNQGATRLFGWTAEEMVGRPNWERLPEGEPRAALLRRLEDLRQGREIHHEREEYRKDGTRFWVEARVFRYNNAQGQAAGIIAILTDITERRRAREELRVAHDRLSLITRAAKDVLWDWNFETRELWWSEGVNAAFGYAPEELAGSLQAWTKLLHPEDQNRVLTELGNLLRVGGTRWEAEYRFRRKNGTYAFIIDRGFIVHNLLGQPARMVGAMVDITDRQEVMEELRRAKEAAEDATRAKSQFLAVMSHEIRTPLNPILGAAQLLLDQGCTDEQREMLQLISSAGEHLLLLLNDILNLAKLEAGRLELAPGIFQVSDLLRGVFDLKRAETSRKRLALHEELDPHLAFCYLGDEARLRQILLNLVGNAIKFTQRGRITVRVRRLAGDGTRDHLRFEVGDTGIGIAPEHRVHIFEPFYQVDSSSSRRYEGAGLGLAICTRLVEMMQGKLGVESEPEQGSTFWFELWLERGQQFAAPADPSVPPAAVPVRRVLLVEDDAHNRAVLVPMLERLNCRVVVAHDGRSALELFEPNGFQVVLLDLRLPDLDGCEVARQMREREAAEGAQRTPLVAQTANTSPADLAAVAAAGMDAFLAKPIQLKNLAETLDRFTQC